MNLIPKVKTLEIREGFLEKNAICFDKDGMDIRLAAVLNKLPCEPNGVRRKVCVEEAHAEDGESVMAEYIAEQPMSLFFLDYDHNAPDAEHLAKTHEAFFLTVREKNPDLPIIMTSETDTPKTPQKAEDILRRHDVILRTYANAVKRGDKKVAFIDGTEVFKEAHKLGVSADSCTVDGVHPNDLGFACMAKVFGEAIKKIL